MTENSEGIAFFISGNSYYKQQRYVEACEAYKKAVKLIPDHVEAYLEWGHALYHLEQYQDTAEKYQKVTELSPDCADAYIGWGYALHNMGSYEEAIHKYQKVAELSPDYADIYFYWGNILLVLGRYEEASEKYQKVTELKPSYADAFFNWGKALDNLNQFEEAINKHKKVINIDSGYTDAYFYWGNELFNINKYEEAIQKYQKVLDLNPEHISAYFNWGQALYNLGKYEEAIIKYRRVLELDPEYADTYFYLGNALYNSDYKEEATHEYKKATELNPDCANAYLYWGEILYALKIYDRAAEKFEKFTQLISNRADTYLKWGNSLQKLHKYAEATEKYQKARELDPQYRTFIYSSNWILFWLIVPLLVLLLLAQVYLSLLFNSMFILDTALIKTSSFKAIHALMSAPVPDFIFINFWQLFFDNVNILNIEDAIQNYAPNVIDIIHYLFSASVLITIETFCIITIYKGVDFALRRDVFLFILLLGFVLTISLSGALFGNVKIAVFTTIIELLFSILAISMVLSLASVGITNIAVYGFVNPNISALRHRATIVFACLFTSIFHAIFDGVLSLILLTTRIIFFLIYIASFSIPSKDFLSNNFRQHLNSSIISIVWIYSINILIYLYFSALNTLGFVFIAITLIQSFLAGYIIFRTLEGDEKFSLLKRFTIDVIATKSTSSRNTTSKEC